MNGFGPSPSAWQCSSRNSTVETANAIAKEAQMRRGPGGGGGGFVRSGVQQQRLAQAAAAAKHKALQASGGPSWVPAWHPPAC